MYNSFITVPGRISLRYHSLRTFGYIITTPTSRFHENITSQIFLITNITDNSGHLHYDIKQGFRTLWPEVPYWVIIGYLGSKWLLEWCVRVKTLTCYSRYEMDMHLLSNHEDRILFFERFRIWTNKIWNTSFYLQKLTKLECREDNNESISMIIGESITPRISICFFLLLFQECYPRVWNEWGICFQKLKERVHFWAFQHPNKKSSKYELLTPKTRKVVMIWRWRMQKLNFLSKNWAPGGWHIWHYT